MNQNARFLFRFFLITFTWSWIVWTPLILCSFKIIPVSDKLLSIMILPGISIGVFGPLVGALFAPGKEHGEGSTARFLRSFYDLNLGWRAYVFPVLILFSTTFIAWFSPELFGEKRLPMILHSLWMFIPYLLLMIFFGGGQEEFGIFTPMAWQILLFRSYQR